MTRSISRALDRWHAGALIATILPVVVHPGNVNAAERWPVRFEYIGPKEPSRSALSEFTTIVLYEDGRAEFDSGVVRRDGSRSSFHATKARWVPDPGGCFGVTQPPGGGRRCILLEMSGSQDGAEARFSRTYHWEDDRLVEFDKAGIQEILMKVEMPGRAR